MVPATATVYGQLVQSPVLASQFPQQPDARTPQQTHLQPLSNSAHQATDNTAQARFATASASYPAAQAAGPTTDNNAQAESAPAPASVSSGDDSEHAGIATAPAGGSSGNDSQHATVLQRAQCQMHACHVDQLWPDHLQLLSEPFEVFRFDFAQPPDGDGTQQIEVGNC